MDLLEASWELLGWWMRKYAEPARLEPFMGSAGGFLSAVLFLIVALYVERQGRPTGSNGLIIGCVGVIVIILGVFLGAPAGSFGGKFWSRLGRSAGDKMVKPGAAIGAFLGRLLGPPLLILVVLLILKIDEMRSK